MIKYFLLDSKSETLASIITQGQSGSGSNCNKGIPGRFPKTPGLEFYHLIVLVSYPGPLIEGGSYPSAEIADGVFYSPSRLG